MKYDYNNILKLHLRFTAEKAACKPKSINIPVFLNYRRIFLLSG
jgi:hypothetical protein